MGDTTLVTDAGAAIRVHGLRKAYGKRIAVDGVDLAVRRGEIFGLIGADGAGKSSLMKAVAGVLAFDDGELEVFGASLDSERAAERIKDRLGFMPQGLGLNLYSELSVEENIDFFAKLRLVPARDLAARKRRLLAVTRLDKFKDRPMKQLSGGMKQKLGLICTLIHEPELVILDEPTTGVDPVSRRDFWAILSELVAQKGITALVSTAYMDEVSRFHRLALLHAGKVLAKGTPADIRAGAQVTGESEADELDLEDVFIALLQQRGLVPVEREMASTPSVMTTQRTSSAIEALDLSRDFGAFRAVDQVSFQVKPGEIFGLLGANGAGKTTVIKMLTGILRPSGGRGRVAGAEMRAGGMAIKERIGYVSQAFSLYLDLSVVENIRLYAGIYGLGGAESRRRTQWVIDMAGLAGHETDRPTALPMGLRQRLALGCALVHRPQVLFLDEPTSGVDPVGRRQFWDILFRLARADGVAILITTHYMSEAEHCDRLALMYAGRIVADDTPEALKREVESEVGGLLDFDVDDSRRALALLREADYAGAYLHGARLRLLSHDPQGDTRRIRDLFAGADLALGDIATRRLSMEDVFVHRVTALERAAEGPAA